jgi:hypothetical protein
MRIPIFWLSLLLATTVTSRVIRPYVTMSVCVLFKRAYSFQIGAPALCKNCLAVGATQLNADQTAADAMFANPNLICLRNPQLSCCPFSCTTQDACSLQTSSACQYGCNETCSSASSSSTQNLALFSSRGPTRYDGRYKPDLVAPGEFILSMSAQASAPDNYCELKNVSSENYALSPQFGTSMSTPLVAGATEYIRQYFIQGFYPTGANVSADAVPSVPEALLRAVMLAGSRRISGKVTIGGALQSLPSQYPNYAIGYGSPVLDRTLFMSGYTGPFANGLQVTKPPLPSFAAGAPAPQLWQFTCGAFVDREVHIVLTWTDPAGNPMATKQIVNDLDLIVITPKNGTVFGNNDAFPDTTNTVEKVTISSCNPDTVVQVAVNPGSVVSIQAYALAVNGNVRMGSLMLLNAGNFTVDTKRPAPLPYSATEPPESSCARDLVYAVIPSRLPLATNPTAFDQTFVERRFAAALAMQLAVDLQAVSVTFISGFSKLQVNMKCSSYICGSPAGICFVSAANVSSALRARQQQLTLLPVSNPLSLVNWIDCSQPNAPPACEFTPTSPPTTSTLTPPSKAVAFVPELQLSLFAVFAAASGLVLLG